MCNEIFWLLRLAQMLPDNGPRPSYGGKATVKVRSRRYVVDYDICSESTQGEQFRDFA